MIRGTVLVKHPIPRLLAPKTEMLVPEQAPPIATQAVDELARHQADRRLQMKVPDEPAMALCMCQCGMLHCTGAMHSLCFYIQNVWGISGQLCGPSVYWVHCAELLQLLIITIIVYWVHCAELCVRRLGIRVDTRVDLCVCVCHVHRHVSPFVDRCMNRHKLTCGQGDGGRF